ncbi:PhoH family protein [Craterilacuibacter sp. RT1T]|uniref:PhoH family protein n=1 Tax=Craterilacuibacter sp. RT1T TaxID=2942211 RepID=UPI0020BF4EF2|nr:PhoH family protein [Craterilacuibacter sp. RT1T]MCL6264066.1 PhoH family protein [Craterilacuibacter sp. RT1T]
MPHAEQLSFNPIDNARLARLTGPLDSNLKQIEIALDVSIARRGEQLRIQGERAREAASALTQLYLQAETRELELEDVQLCLVELRQNPVAASSETDSSPALRTRRGDLRGRTPRQVGYIRAMLEHTISFGIGPAGTGKTYLAVACAVDAFERDAVKRIVLVRPAVEAGEKLGFLPGDLAQKVDPYLRPLYDALYDLIGSERVERMLEKGQIEIAPLAYMRGRTLNNAFIILDEAQNTTPEQMKMFLTRIGFGSRAVITGDITQIDLARHQKSGLVEVEQILGHVRGLHFHHFNSDDVVRHPLVQKIVDAYEHYQQKNDEKSQA